MLGSQYLQGAGMCVERENEVYRAPCRVECIWFPMNPERTGVCVGGESDVYRACFRVWWVPNEFRESWGVCWKREWCIPGLFQRVLGSQ